MKRNIKNIKICIAAGPGHYKLTGEVNECPITVIITDSEIYDNMTGDDRFLRWEGTQSAKWHLLKEFNQLYSFELLQDQEGEGYFNYYGEIHYIFKTEMKLAYIDFKNQLVYIK